MAVEIKTESTPNPNSMKFIVNQSVSPRTQWFANAGAASGNPMATAIFAVEGVANVMLLNNFVTVGKGAGASWDALVEPITALIQSHMS